MKKYSLSVICVVLFALLAGCGSKETSNITVDYGDSAVYTEQDMDDAIKDRRDDRFVGRLRIT